MDLLSRLLSLMPVTGSLDARCHFGAPWRLDNGASQEHEIPYHVLLRGTAVVEDGRGPPLHMTAGDIVLFPSGSAHVLHDGGGKRPVKSGKRIEAGLEVIANHGKGEAADVLCGRFHMPAVPQLLLRDHLPGRLLVHSVKAAADMAPLSDASVAGTRLARLIQLMREEALEQGPGSISMVNHLSGALFGLTLRFASEAGEPPRGLLALSQRARLQPALAAMFDQPGEPWSLPQLAALCHMSRATFARHFDEAIGRSASDMLTEIRMAMAGRKLAQGTLSVAEIGEQVGYRSDAAFQRAFKKVIGATPAQWRTQARSVKADAHQ